jgi:soluble lytic murein transglycosylase-like protein
MTSTPALASPTTRADGLQRQAGLLAILMAFLTLGHASTVTSTQPNTKIFRYMQGGTTSFSDVPPSKTAYVVHHLTCYACSVTSNINWQSTPLHLQAWGDEIEKAAQQYGLEPSLVRAVIHAESGFNARARSPKGAMGLMQLMPATARDLGVADAHIPSNNIRGGAQYLARLLARFKNNVTLATAAYNAGPEAVQKYAGVPPYAETQVYVQRVKILQQRYKESSRS